MILKFYSRLSTRSRRAILRQTKKWGHENIYFPRYQLVKNLMTEFNMTENEVLDQLQKEREFLLRFKKYY